MKNKETIIRRIRKRYQKNADFYKILAEECEYDREMMQAIGKHFASHGGSKRKGTGIHRKVGIVIPTLTVCPHLRVCYAGEPLCADSSCPVNKVMEVK